MTLVFYDPRFLMTLVFSLAYALALFLDQNT